MSVFFNLSAQRELLRAYADAHARIDEALPHLHAQTSEAADFIDAAHAMSATHDLATTATGLMSDRVDLSERAAFVQAADARTAFLLGTTTGRLINPNLANRALREGWTYDEALDHQLLALTLGQPRPHTAQQVARTGELTERLGTTARPFTVGMVNGDLDSDLATPRVGEPLRISASTPTERGRQLLLRALSDTTNPDQIQRDEFSAYFHDSGALTIVLPGVIDLSNPQLGSDPESNSLRDLDQHAVRSAYNTNIENNGYASRVVDWVEYMSATGVIPPGTPTAIVGHSFGADTAFDLAANDRFNGELLDVTHVFAAGYDTESYFADVPEHTRTMSTRNIYDVVAFAEVAARQGTRLATNRVAVELLEAGLNLDHTLTKAAVQAVQNKNDDRDDNRHDDGGESHDRETRVAVPVVELAGNTFREVAPNSTDITFEGDFDFESFGHHPDSYAAFLENKEAPGVADFFVELDTQGFTNNAVALSIDISDPAS